MKGIIATKELGNGRYAFIVEVASSGGGEYRHPGVLRLMTTDRAGFDSLEETTRYKGNKKFKEIEFYNVDLRYTGPRSHYYKALGWLTGKMDKMK